MIEMTYEMYSDLIFENAEKFVHFVKTEDFFIAQIASFSCVHFHYLPTNILLYKGPNCNKM